ncbi:hypothetical protein TraAM80_02850 [Trypanosoma rangeli]|uniref:CUE domain-containing protein n=1 Tax=Trypanosoma rangeli TaxID=5698 RepID=A0A422NSD1_TRYRA|nr:uncharacterized protein TraAM80_02850 [Trypanosoma rangeli]RNF08390.1 hypothetical protein TraAM80_02850 [Trypanosoma rangeli]|eukprot:RNF08390.1 hypothetical protein TraAM80_02850 [Trypanosoma rangeli]
MSRTLKERFPDPDAAVCSTFFRTTDVCDKTWCDMALIAESDDHTFWTVIANHKSLTLTLRNLITVVDNAHSSAFRRQLQRSDELSLITFLVRLVTTTSVVSSAGVSVASVASCLEQLIPPALLMPLSLIILRHCGSVASATVTTLILLNPSYLCTMPVTASSWCDATARLSVQCVKEVARGRHQRLAGDVVLLFEQVYRHVKQLWALVHCAPFLADYMPLSRLLQYLRVVVDLLSPLLQHFLLTCTALSNRREQLSKANSAIVNAAVNVASILVLFRTYHKVESHDRCHCVERIVAPTYDALTSHITRKVQGLPSVLLSDTRRCFTRTLHELVPPQTAAQDLEVGKVLRHLSEPVPDSKDFSNGFLGARPRYFELLLLELVHQGFHIDVLLEKKFITLLEAEELGASERVITQTIAGIIDKATGDAAMTTSGGGNYHSTGLSTVEESASASSDPLISIVLGVMPHFNVDGIKAALHYYNGDVEQFILDASMDNVAPHLLAQLTEPSPSNVVGEVAQVTAWTPEINANTTGVSTSTVANTLTVEDYDNDFDVVDLNLFIGSDLYEAINGGDGTGAAEDPSCDLVYTTYRSNDHRGAAEMFEVDEAMREKIRMLAELMYEDEFDDTQEVAEVCAYEACQGANDSDSAASNSDVDMIHNLKSNLSEGGEIATSASRRPRTQYDEKRFHEARSKREKSGRAAEAREAVPAYTQKKKTTRKKTQDKGALTRQVKKGKFN